MKVRKKLVITYFVIIIIPLASLGFFAYSMSSSLLNQQLQAMLGANTSQLASFLSNRLDKNNEFLRFTAFSPYLLEDFNGEPKDWFSISRKISRYFEPVAWYNMVQNQDYDELKIYFEYLDTSIGAFISPSAQVMEEEWYKRVCNSQATEWYFQDGELYATRRIWNAGLDLLLGAIQMKMDFGNIMDSIVAEMPDENGVLLTSSDGTTVLYASDTELLNNADAVNTFVAGDDKSISVNGIDYYVVSQQVANYGWKLYSYTSKNSYTSQRSQIIYIVVLIIGVCFIILLVLIRVFSSTLLKRLEMLSSQMSRIDGLDSKSILPVTIRDEVGILTDRFGELLGQVYKSELMLKQEELNTLQAQISPHFLYNTLSLINGKAIESDNNEIGRIANLISTFYRTCLSKGQSLIRVSDEIANIKSYVDLQLIMHDNSFDVEYDIDERILAFETVNFTLQPLVENAIIHGLDENENKRGMLFICAKFTDEGEVKFVVQDNGVGMNEKTVEKLFTSESKGYGVKNANQRIKLCFGDDYGIRVFSKQNEGTTATLLIPAHF